MTSRPASTTTAPSTSPHPVSMRPFDEADFSETFYVTLPSLAAAIAAVMCDHGAQVRTHATASMTSLLVSDTGQTGRVRVGVDEDIWYSFMTTISDTDAWEAETAAERHFLLKDALSDLDVGRGAPLMDYLTGTVWQEALFSPDRYVQAMRNLAVAVWWERRMTEGHTPGPDGSAHLLLALLVPPALLRHLTYSPEGVPAFLPA